MAKAEFTQAMVSRAVRGAIIGARKEGFEVGAIKVTPEGNVLILPPQARETSRDAVEAWFQNEDQA